MWKTYAFFRDIKRNWRYGDDINPGDSCRIIYHYRPNCVVQVCFIFRSSLQTLQLSRNPNRQCYLCSTHNAQRHSHSYTHAWIDIMDTRKHTQTNHFRAHDHQTIHKHQYINIHAYIKARMPKRSQGNTEIQHTQLINHSLIHTYAHIHTHIYTCTH